MKNKNGLYILIVLLFSAFIGFSFHSPLIVNAEDNSVLWTGGVEAFTLLNDAEINSESNPYVIDTADKLAYLAQQVNSGQSFAGVYFKQTANLDLGAIYNEDTNSYSGLNWVAVGYFTSSTNYKYFSGIYDGNNYSIINVSQSEINSSFGIFGATNSAVIKNLSLQVHVENNLDDTGGLIGYAKNTSVDNIQATVQLQGHGNNVGGLFGRVITTLDTTITNITLNGKIQVETNGALENSGALCGLIYTNAGTLSIDTITNYMQITGTQNIGGVVGCVQLSTNVTLKNAINYVTITCNSASSVGGMIGLNDGAVLQNCGNEGQIESTNGNNVGGIVGCGNSIIFGCYNNAPVVGGNMTGGIAGFNSAKIDNCKNTGGVEGVNAGGIVGEFVNNNGRVQLNNSFNIGQVIATNVAGGLIANANNVLVQRSFNGYELEGLDEIEYGVQGNTLAGGLVGIAQNINLDTSFNGANVKSDDTANGIIGQNTSSDNMMVDIYFIGYLSGDYVAGLTDNLSNVSVRNSYFVVKLGSDTEYLGFYSVFSSTYDTFENVYYNTDTCAFGYPAIYSNIEGINAITTNDLLNANVFNLEEYYVGFESEIEKEEYSVYYPLLDDFVFGVSNSENENYTIWYSFVQKEAFYNTTKEVLDAVVVNFVTNSDTELDPIVVKQNVNIASILPTVSKENLKFLGWYTDANFNNAFNANSPLLSSVTLYAKYGLVTEISYWWIVLIIIVVLAGIVVVLYFVMNKKRTIIFKLNGVSIPNQINKSGSVLDLPVLKKEGYEFNGWYYNSELTKKFELTAMPNVDLVLFGEFKKVQEAPKKTPEKKKTTKKSTTNSKSKKQNIKE